MLVGMHRSLGRSFGFAEYRPFLLWFGLAEAVAISAESTAQVFIELKICETFIAVIELTCVANFATLFAT